MDCSHIMKSWTRLLDITILITWKSLEKQVFPIAGRCLLLPSLMIAQI